MDVQHAALSVTVDPGGTPVLAEPVPPLSLVSLEALLSPRIREWLIIDGADVRLAGHRFVIVGWTMDCLVWKHIGAHA
jgi:hypothetical protein